MRFEPNFEGFLPFEEFLQYLIDNQIEFRVLPYYSHRKYLGLRR